MKRGFRRGGVFQFRFQHKIGNCQSQSRKLTMPTMTMLQFENTFVQFYPTLEPIAQKFVTYRQSLRIEP
jgi:hypothetical protein